MRTAEQCSRTPFINKGISLPLTAIIAERPPAQERSKYAKITRFDEITAGWTVTNIRETSQEKIGKLTPNEQTALWNQLSRKDQQIDDAEILDFNKVKELAMKDARAQQGFIAARDTLVHSHRDFAGIVASRYAGKGFSVQHLESVGKVALVESAERFTPEKGYFADFAYSTIQGKILREFRDYYGIHQARRDQERSQMMQRTRDRLAQDLQRTVTPQDVANEINKEREQGDDITVKEVQERLQRVKLLSRDGWGQEGEIALFAADPEDIALADPTQDPEGQATNHVDLRRAWPFLPERDRKVLELRFWGDMTQSQIAAEVGVSQMHVSRILGRALGRMRTLMEVTETSQPEPTATQPSNSVDSIEQGESEQSLAAMDRYPREVVNQRIKAALLEEPDISLSRIHELCGGNSVRSKKQFGRYLTRMRNDAVIEMEGIRSTVRYRLTEVGMQQAQLELAKQDDVLEFGAVEDVPKTTHDDRESEAPTVKLESSSIIFDNGGYGEPVSLDEIVSLEDNIQEREKEIER